MSRLVTPDGNPESDLDREVDRRYPLKIGPTMASIPADELAVLQDKAAALDLLEQWLDVHPLRHVSGLAKSAGRFGIILRGADGEPYSSTTQETLASAIRTVIMIAQHAGDK